MFPPPSVLRRRLGQMIDDREAQGRAVAGLRERLLEATDDLQRLHELARQIDVAPLLPERAHVEPSGLEEIRAESTAVSRASDGPSAHTLDEWEARARAGFLGSVAGCVLGKPVEVMPTMHTLRAALQMIGDWPLDDYISHRIHTDGGFERLHHDAPWSVREQIRFVPADDDINYTILGMLVLEQHGRSFTQAQLARAWLENLPLAYTWGPERTFLTKMALAMGVDDDPEVDFSTLADTDNPGSEMCGAMIRADAYGYACPGQPELSTELAWRDASLTHRGNGIYGSMFVAAAISLSFTIDDPLELVENALAYIPRRSRFAVVGRDSLERVARASDWVEGYESIHEQYREYGHCRVFQELGTLINTLKFADSTGHGICLQVSQGNDTDSYGEIAGALLGVRWGASALEGRWLEPFNDEIRTRVAGFYEGSLSRTADRVARLVRQTTPTVVAASSPVAG